MKPLQRFALKIPARVNRWLTLRQPSQTLVLGGAALLVGVTSGVGVWLFKRLIDLFNLLLFDNLGRSLTGLAGWLIFIVPVTGGLAVGWIMQHFIGEERHHGVAGIMEAEALAGGRLRYRRIPVKTVAAALSVGSGASVGPEDPSVQIGANLGSFFGQALHLSEDWVRALVAAGAAGGISAAFNAPIAGIFFAMEVILGEFSSNAFSVVVLSSVISAVFTQAVSGPQPAFHVPAYEFRSAWELPLYLGLGLLAGPVSAAYITLLDRARQTFSDLHIPAWIKPGIAGLAVGLTGIFIPQIFGVGYSTIDNILHGAMPNITLLILILLAKLLMTPVSIGGGFPGGVVAPSLFLGAMLGAAYGVGMEHLVPALNLDAPAFAMVGMAAVLAGAISAPLTAILLLFEMTNDYRIILPLMMAVVVSMLIARRLQPDSIYSLQLARKGVRLEHGLDVEILDRINVGEVMRPVKMTLNEGDTLGKAAEEISRAHEHGLPVVNGTGDLAGILTLEDIQRAQTEEVSWQRLTGEAASHDLLTAFPDETIRAAVLRMGTRNIGSLPVVERENPRRLVGMLSREELVTAYNIAMTRRAAVRHRAGQVRLGAISSLAVEDVVIQPGSACDGKRIQEIPWPQDCVIASLRRGRNIFIPHGSTLLLKGDVLVAVAQGPARDELRKLCQPRNTVKPADSPSQEQK